MSKTTAEKILRAAAVFVFAAVSCAALVYVPSYGEGKKTKIERLLKAELDEFWLDEGGWTQLHWAAAANDAEAARRLLEIGLDPNITDSGRVSSTAMQRFKLLGKEQKDWNHGKITPLLAAVWFDSPEVASVLIANGADVNAKDEFRLGGWKAYALGGLHLAGKANAPEVAKILIESGADVNDKDERGYTPLYWAVVGKANAPEVAKILIESGADVNDKDERGETPLYLAARSNAVEVAKLLIEHGADVNEKNNNGYTPLHHAVGSNAVEVAKLLIEHGADINAKDKFGRTPATANRAKTTEMRNLLSQQVEVARSLIASGADVNAKDKFGRTPANEAKTTEMRNLLSQQVEVARSLIASGADVNAKDEYDWTRLHWAAAEDAAEAVTILIEGGVDVNTKGSAFYVKSSGESVKSRDGWTPLHAAAANNAAAAAKALLDNGADVNAKALLPVNASATKARKGPIVIDFGKIIVNNLLKSGADVNAKGETKDERGWTSLHEAALRDLPEMAKLLIDRGADVNVKNDLDDSTPLDQAINEKHAEMQSLLSQHGGRCNILC